MFNSSEYLSNVEKLKRFVHSYQKRTEAFVSAPLIYSILVTNKCNLSCKHCFYHATIDNNNSLDDQLSIDEYEKISRSMGWFLTGIFCGGEPYIREDFSEIISIFQKNNRIITADAASNGLLTDSILSQTEAIISSSAHQTFTLGISIDGFREQHDELRGYGTFDAVMETWRELKTLESHYSNFHPYICTTLNSLNEEGLDKFVQWSMRELKPNKISLLKIRQNPRDGEFLKDISYDNYDACAKRIWEYISEGLMGDVNKPQTYFLCSIYDLILKTIQTGARQFHCYAGKYGGFIDYNGDVGFCEILDCIGNLRDFEYDISKLWVCERATELRKKVNHDKLCVACTHESEGFLPSIYFHPNDSFMDSINERSFIHE